MSGNYEGHEGHDEIEYYGDPLIASKNAPVPLSLRINYVVWIIVGFAVWFFFWNGSYGWLDRGYWQQLQRAANTTYPFKQDVVAEEIPGLKKGGAEEPSRARK